MAKSLMRRSKVLLRYWGECILTSVYLINRTLTMVLSNETPYFKFFMNNQKPSSGRVMVFKFAIVTKQIGKFEPRTEKGVFLGYSFSKKGYNVLSLDIGVILVSRDVSFHETTFPFHKGKDASDF